MIWKWIKSNVLLAALATLLTAGAVGGSYWAIATFQAGYKLEKKQEIKDILVDLMIDKEQMNIFVGQALDSDTLKIVREISNTNIIKSVVELSKGDSINLRKEIRLYMDLKESQTVSKEIAWTYKQMHRLPKLVDSILSARRRRTPNVTSH